MNWQLSIASWAYFATAALAALIGIMIWRRRQPGAVFLAVLMLAAAEWALAAGMEVSAIGQAAKIFWSKVEYLGNISSTTLLILFVLEYTQQDRWLTRSWRLLLWALPVFFLGVVWSNELHGWLWTGFEAGPAGSNMLIYLHGPAFILLVGYHFSLVLLANVLLLQAAWRWRGAHRAQALWLMVGTLFPVIGALIYTQGIFPVRGLDTTPFSFVLTGSLLTFVIYRFRLFDLIPVARHVLMENLPDGVVVLDTRNRIMDINSAARRLLWVSDASSFIGQDVAALFNAWPEVLELFQNIPAEQSKFQIEVEAPPLEVQASRLLDKQERFYGWVVMLQDVSARRLNENALRLLSQAVEQSPASVVITDLDGSIRYVNPYFTQVTGYTSDEAFGLNPRILKSDQTPPETYRDLWSTLVAGKEWRGEFCNRKKNGDLYWEYAVIAPVLNEQGVITHYVAVKEVVTERKQAETLLKIQRDLGLALNLVKGVQDCAQKVLDALCQVGGISGGGVYRLEASGEYFEMICHCGLSQRMVERGARFLVDSPRAQIFQHGEPVYTRYGEIAFHNEQIRQEESIQAVALIPIFHEGRLIAALSLISYTLTELPLATRNALEVIAAQAGAVFARLDAEATLVRGNAALELQVQERTGQLQNTIQELESEIADRERVEQTLRETEDKLIQRVADQSRKLAALYEVILMGGRALEMNEMLTQSLSKIVAVLAGGAACIHLYNQMDASDALVLVAAWGLKATVQSRFKVLHENWRESEHVPLLVTSADQDTASLKLLPPGYQALLRAAIQLRGQTVGVLSVFWGEVHQFPVEDIALFSVMADQLGVLMENVRLRQRSEQAAVIQERRRLARDLHDSVTQSLHSLVLSADIARNRLSQGKLERLDISLTQLSESAVQALKEMRLLLYEMRLIPLEQMDMMQALTARVDAVERRAGVEVVFDTASAVWPRAWEGELYAIAMESLNNALKYAQASHITFRLDGNEDQFNMEITDNGLGFDPSQVNPGGIGLKSMAERAERLGGVLQIDSTPGKGTRLQVIIRK